MAAAVHGALLFSWQLGITAAKDARCAIPDISLINKLWTT